MKFRVTRSSQFFDEKPRNVKNIYEKGDGWYIKINTLEELIAFYEEYGSISEASRQTGINIMSISCCANKKRKSGGGYLWHFV